MTTCGRWRARPWPRPGAVQADDAAILAYVREIVRTNADVFVVPGDPDLVYPGQRFVLPPVALT